MGAPTYLTRYLSSHAFQTLGDLAKHLTHIPWHFLKKGSANCLIYEWVFELDKIVWTWILRWAGKGLGMHAFGLVRVESFLMGYFNGVNCLEACDMEARRRG